jgi:hypothetical protein
LLPPRGLETVLKIAFQVDAGTLPVRLRFFSNFLKKLDLPRFLEAGDYFVEYLGEAFGRKGGPMGASNHEEE